MKRRHDVIGGILIGANLSTIMIIGISVLPIIAMLCGVFVILLNGKNVTVEKKEG